MPEKKQNSKKIGPYQQLLNEKMSPEMIEKKLGIEPALPPVIRLPKAPSSSTNTR